MTSPPSAPLPFWIGSLYSPHVEHPFHAPQELVPDRPLLDGQRLEPNPDVDRRRAEGVEPEHLQRLQDERTERLVRLHAVADLAQRLDHLIDVLAVGDAHLHQRVREVLGHVEDGRHLAERHGMDVAAEVAQPHRADGHALDDAAVAVHPLLQRRKPIPGLLVDPNAPLHRLVQSTDGRVRDEPGDQRHHRRPNQELESSRRSRGPYDIDRGDVGDGDEVPDLGERAPNPPPSARGPATGEPRAHRLPVLQHEHDHHGCHDQPDELLRNRPSALRDPEQRQRLGDEDAVDRHRRQAPHPEEQVVRVLVGELDEAKGRLSGSQQHARQYRHRPHDDVGILRYEPLALRLVAQGVHQRLDLRGGHGGRVLALAGAHVLGVCRRGDAQGPCNDEWEGRRDSSQWPTSMRSSATCR